jgi:hypothetical protein
MGEIDRAELEILPNPVTKLRPLVLGMMAIVGGTAASLIPSIVGRIAAWALLIGVISHLYLTAVRRLVVREDAVEIEFTRKTARIPYSNLDHVTVRAMHLAGLLNVVFVLKDRPGTIRAGIGLMSDEVLKTAPQLVRALIVRGVDVRVPGRPDVGTG